MDEARRLDTQSSLRKFYFPFYFVHLFNWFVGFITCVLLSKMDLGKKRSLEVKKAIVARVKARGSSASSAKVGSKRKG